MSQCPMQVKGRWKEQTEYQSGQNINQSASKKYVKF